MIGKPRLVRGPVFHDREPTSLRYLDGETHLRGEKGNSQANIVYDGDTRPEGCDLIAHGTVKEQVGYASRVLVTLTIGIEGGCNKPRQLLRRARDKFGFRLYPVLDNGEETNEYTVSQCSERAITYLQSKRGVWIDRLDETPIRLPGNGAVDHIARKPKRKASDFHPDYRRSEAGRAVRIRHEKPKRKIEVI